MDFGAIDKIESLIKDMEKIGVVEYAEPAPLFFISQTVNDPYYNRTLNYTPSGLEFLYGSAFSVNSSWHLDLINAEEAWDETDGSDEITVAVLDNAIYIDHEDLTHMIDRENSIDLGDGDNDPNPPVANYIWSHGTHSAGLIGAEKNNNIGVASIGSGVKIMAVKLGTDASDGQSMAAGFEGIIYAADHGADVINMSWGSPQFFQTMQNIVNYAYNKGCILLGAAGNNGNGAESQMNEDIPVNYTGYPAALEHVIAVGSCNSDDKKSDFSCYGTWLDLLSPGGYAYQATGMMPITSFSVLSTTYNTAGTFGEMLREELKDYGYKPCVMQLTDPLYNYAKNYFDWDGNKDEKPREFFQKLGIDIIRDKMGKKYFLLNRLFEDIEILSNFFDTFIITDARLIHEFESIKEKYQDVVLIKLERKNYNDKLTEEERNHITEKEIDAYNNFDYIIENKSLDDLNIKALEVVRNEENYEGELI